MSRVPLDAAGQPHTSSSSFTLPQLSAGAAHHYARQHDERQNQQARPARHLPSATSGHHGPVHHLPRIDMARGASEAQHLSTSGDHLRHPATVLAVDPSPSAASSSARTRAAQASHVAPLHSLAHGAHADRPSAAAHGVGENSIHRSGGGRSGSSPPKTWAASTDAPRATLSVTELISELLGQNQLLETRLADEQAGGRRRVDRDACSALRGVRRHGVGRRLPAAACRVLLRRLPADGLPLRAL
jgi:hypothetical protein